MSYLSGNSQRTLELVSLYKGKEKKEVLRITIDERLSEDLVQLMIAKLKSTKDGEYNLLGDLWSEEEVYQVDTLDWASFLSNYYLKKYPFQNLKEGQVYIFGPIGIQSRGKSQLIVFKGNKKLISITEYIKRDTKNLYNKALLGIKTNSEKER